MADGASTMNSCVCVRRRGRRGSLILSATVLLLSITLATAASAASATTGPVESANARFLVASYRQFLGRAPAAAGLDFHLDRLVAGGDRSREQVARALLFGPEGSANEVDRAYRNLLGRGPEQSGSAFWTMHLQTHDVLDLRVLLMSSDEYHRASGGSDESWIAALYRDVLGRAPEPRGAAYWAGEAARGVPRPLIVAGFYQGPESLGRRTVSYYRLTLGREPTAGERAAGSALIAAAGERALYARLWASDEAFEQFFDDGWRP